MRIHGKANDVFNSIKNICQRNPDMTLKEVLKGGLLATNLKNTKPLIVGEYPYVSLNEGYDKN